MPPIHPSLQLRNDQLRKLADPLPGSHPRDNVRPIRIPGRLDRWKLLDCVCEMHPPIDRQTWIEWFSQGQIRRHGLPANPMTVVRGGEAFEHVFPNVVEPDVNRDIVIRDEDDSMIVVEKPAPLPVHPSGRFDRNTLTALLQLVYPRERLRPVHRLDANTSGLMLIARTAEAASHLAKQFESGAVRKRYLVRCVGIPKQSEFVCETPISAGRGEGGTRTVDFINGKPAVTRFRLLHSFPDGTSLLEAMPVTGRTNQIRIHLWSLEIPVMGDPSYQPNGRITAWQTLGIDEPPMCLHASALSLLHPATGRRIEWTSHGPGWARQNQELHQEDFSFSDSASNLAISASSCANSDGSSA